jgi:maltose O-acetyltransferase
VSRFLTSASVNHKFRESKLHAAPRWYNLARWELISLRHSFHLRLLIANAISGLLPAYTGAAIRMKLYRWAGFDFAKSSWVGSSVRLMGSSTNFYDNLVVGSGSGISNHVTINLDGKVTIGSNVNVSPHVLIYTASHAVGLGSSRMSDRHALSVTIEDGAWIRLGAIIAPGVSVGAGSIVATGAVVLNDVPPNTYVEGNPARVVRELPWGEDRGNEKVLPVPEAQQVRSGSTGDALRALVASVLDIPEEEVEDSSSPSTTSSWDSMAHLALVAAVEETYGVRLSAHEERSMQSVGVLRNMLSTKGVNA